MKRGSPLKKCWKPGMDDHYLIVIDDDDVVNTCCFFNYIFNNIHRYTYENKDDNNVNPLQRYFFWKNIRGFIEFHYKRILKKNIDDMRIRLLSGNLYDYACHQENMFQQIDFSYGCRRPYSFK